MSYLHAGPTCIYYSSRYIVAYIVEIDMKSVTVPVLKLSVCVCVWGGGGGLSRYVSEQRQINTDHHIYILFCIINRKYMNIYIYMLVD